MRFPNYNQLPVAEHHQAHADWTYTSHVCVCRLPSMHTSSIRTTATHNHSWWRPARRMLGDLWYLRTRTSYHRGWSIKCLDGTKKVMAIKCILQCVMVDVYKSSLKFLEVCSPPFHISPAGDSCFKCIFWWCADFKCSFGGEKCVAERLVEICIYIVIVVLGKDADKDKRDKPTQELSKDLFK